MILHILVPQQNQHMVMRCPVLTPLILWRRALFYLIPQIPPKKSCPPHARSNCSPHNSHNCSPLHPPIPVSRSITMGNHPESYSGKDDVPSVWPDPLWAMRGSPYYPHPSVPQSTHPVLCSAAGYSSTAGSYLPDPGFNAADDAAFSLGPIAEIGVFANLPIQADSINQVSSQCVETSTWTYPAV